MMIRRQIVANGRGLIIRHGLSLGSVLGSAWRSLRTGRCRFFFLASLCKRPTSEPSIATGVGRLALHAAMIRSVEARNVA